MWPILEVIGDLIRDQEKALSLHARHLHRRSNRHRTQQRQAAHQRSIKYVERYAVRHYAEAALHAMAKSPDPKNPVFVAMEGIFPERFGGHPQELKWLIEKSREKMVEYLTSPEIELGVSYEGKPALKKKPDGTLELQKQPNPWFKKRYFKR